MSDQTLPPEKNSADLSSLERWPKLHGWATFPLPPLCGGAYGDNAWDLSWSWRILVPLESSEMV